MKILLLGKTGQVGVQVLAIAKKSKIDIKAFTKEELNIADKVKVYKAIEIYKPDVVINASGYHVVSDCELYPDKAFEINTYALKNLAVACRAVNARLVNFSTDKVFDGTKKTPYTENDRPNPIQIYGMSKLAGEIASHNYHSRSFTIRTCGVYGGLTGSRIKRGNFVLYILNEAKTKKTLEISMEQIASFVNAHDLANATLSLLKKNADSGIYHIVNSGYGSWADFAQEIVSIAKLKLKIVPVDRSGVYSDIKIPVFAALDNSKTKALGIDLPDWKDGLKRYIDFLKEKQS